MNSDVSPTYIDGFLPGEDFERLATFFQDTTWKFGWGSNTIGESYLYWNRHFAGEGKSTMASCEEELHSNVAAQPVRDTWRMLKEKVLPNHTLIRCYANAHTFGLDGTIHRDNNVDVDATTTIIYCHRLWPLPWGGEIIFYNDDNDGIINAVIPKPGRVVIFKGSVPHAAKSPARVCRGLRISLVFKSLCRHDLI